MRHGEAHLVARAELQVDVLSYGCRCTIGTRLVSLLLTKLRPCFPLRNAVVYDRLLKYTLNLLRDLQETFR